MVVYCSYNNIHDFFLSEIYSQRSRHWGSQAFLSMPPEKNRGEEGLVQLITWLTSCTNCPWSISLAWALFDLHSPLVQKDDCNWGGGGKSFYTWQKMFILCCSGRRNWNCELCVEGRLTALNIQINSHGLVWLIINDLQVLVPFLGAPPPPPPPPPPPHTSYTHAHTFWTCKDAYQLLVQLLASTVGKGCSEVPLLGRVCVKNSTLAFHPALIPLRSPINFSSVHAQ